MSEFDVKQYIAHRKSEVPEIIEAYDLQSKIEMTEKNLADYREAYDELMRKIAEREIRGTFFNVTDLKPRREVNIDYVREKLPEVYDRCATLSNTAIVDILETTSGGRASLVKSLKKLDPRKYNESVKINVGDMEKVLGKRRVAEMDGTAIRTVYRPSSKTRVLYIGDKIRIGAGDNEPQEEAPRYLPADPLTADMMGEYGLEAPISSGKKKSQGQAGKPQGALE